MQLSRDFPDGPLLLHVLEPRQPLSSTFGQLSSKILRQVHGLTRYRCQESWFSTVQWLRLDASGRTSPVGFANPTPLPNPSRLSCPRQEAHTVYPLQDCREEFSRNRYFGQLERHVSGVMDYLGSNFDEFLSQRGQGPVFDFTGKGQTAKEVPEVVWPEKTTEAAPRCPGSRDMIAASRSEQSSPL